MRGSNVKPTLLVGFATLLLVLVATALTGITQINSINAEMDEIIHGFNRKISLMTTMRNVARERSLLLQSMLLTPDPFEREKLSLSLDALSVQYIEARQELLTLPLPPEEQRLLQQQHRISVATGNLQNQLAHQLITDDEQGVYEKITRQILPGQRLAMGLMDQFIERQQTQSEKVFIDAERRLRTVAITLLILLAIGIAIGATIAMFVTRRIQSELNARLRSERELQKSELREQIIRENIHDGILITDRQGTIQSLNLAVSVVFDYEGDELVGKNIETVFGDGRGHQALALFESLFASEDAPLFELTRELPGRRKDGSQLPVEVEVTQVHFDGEPHFIVVLRDITTRKEHEQLLMQHNEELERKVKARTQELTEEIEERRRAEEKLLYLASHDNLTGLPNRRLFMEQLELTLRRAHRQQTHVAVYFIDLDGFKAVNDNHGHDIGDKLLIDVARRLTALMRESDVASRMGGDEFTLIAADLERPDDARLIADKLVRTLCQPFRCDSAICQIGASIGISLYPGHGHEAEHLIQMADNAMYQVKNSGKRGYLLHGSQAVCQPLLIQPKS